jgi:hypothetical protein
MCVVAAGGVYAWFRHENAVERAVHRQPEGSSGATDWVSCTEDHTTRLHSGLIIFYRCHPHGGAQDGIEICAPFRGERLLTPSEASEIPLTVAFCRNQA